MGNKNKSLQVGKRHNLLYVALHGLISLVDEGKKGYIAFLLEMGEEHRYLYGDWLLEDVIPPRRTDPIPERGEDQTPLEATLTGVKHVGPEVPASQLDPQFNAVLKVAAAPSFNHPAVRAIFGLPRPRRIYYFICGKVGPNSFTVKPSEFINNKPPDFVSAIRLFEYEVLTDKHGRPLAKLVSKDRNYLWICPSLAKVKKTHNSIAVLHIYDEPGLRSPDPKGHNLREFDRSIAFLGKDGTLQTPTTDPISFPHGQPRIHGFLPGELNSLDQRESNVEILLNQTRTGKISADSTGSGGQVCSGGNGRTSG